MRRGIAPRRFGLHRAALLLLLLAGAARADELDFRPPASPTDPATAEIMRDLAVRVLPVYQDKDPLRFLSTVSALQMAARNYTAATVTRRTLRERRRGGNAGRPAREVFFDVYAQARAVEGEQRLAFATSLSRAYAANVAPLDDHDAYAVTALLDAPPASYADALQGAFDRQRSRDAIGQEEAVALIWTYLDYDAHRSMAPLAASLEAAEEQRRYVSEKPLQLRVTGGGALSVRVVRPRQAGKPLPALLEFNIDPSRDFTRENAAHGYAGVVAYVRGRFKGQGAVVPYQFDGADARRVIDWIVRQPWSDGRVGMFGDRYSGFAAWAALERRPAALQAVATAMPTAPGIDAPMAGNVFQNSAFRWSLYVTQREPDADRRFYDDALWRALDQKWYRSGRRYRDLGLLYGTPNPLFIRWLNHPSYDDFWQRMIPYRAQFARIDIPVLTISGYFAGSQPAALYYFNEHLRHDPKARHTLLIGPYDDAAIQRGALPTLQGYAVDAAALLDLRELRYQWFDHVLKGGAAPAVLKDRVNFELMGANEWHHAPTLAGMADESLRFWLDPSAAMPDAHHLSLRRPRGATFIRQIMDLKDRGDAAWTAPTDFISRSLASRNGLVFVSDPFDKPLRFNGAFSGRLDFTMNKMDMDLNLSLFELTPQGDYVQLFNPTYEFRASYARDRTRRHLLQAGVRQQISFRSERMTSRQFQAGSRLVMLLGLGKRPDREINYGTGNDVSEESMLDADEPFKIRWYADSHIDIPIRR